MNPFVFVLFGTISNQEPVFFLLLIYINFKCSTFYGKSLKGVLTTLSYQMGILEFTQTIEPSVMIFSSLSKIPKNVSPEKVDASNSRDKICP